MTTVSANIPRLGTAQFPVGGCWGWPKHMHLLTLAHKRDSIHFVLPLQKPLHAKSVIDCESPPRAVNKSKHWRGLTLLKIVLKEQDSYCSCDVEFALKCSSVMAYKQQSLCGRQPGFSTHAFGVMWVQANGGDEIGVTCFFNLLLLFGPQNAFC